MSDSKTDVVNAMEHVDNRHSGSGHPEKIMVGDSAKHVAGDALLLDSQGNVRNLPIPSNDPHDPLNFPTWMKATIIFSCCWFCESTPSPCKIWRTFTMFKLLTFDPL